MNAWHQNDFPQAGDGRCFRPLGCTVYVVTVLCLCLYSGAGKVWSEEKQPEAPFTLRIKYVNNMVEPNSLSLVFIWNGADTVKTTERWMPWEAAARFLLIATVPERQAAMRQAPGFLDGISDREMKIAPGERVWGTIPLYDRFKWLPEVLQTFDVVFFWSYQFVDNVRTLNKYPWVSGYFVLPKRNSSNDILRSLPGPAEDYYRF